MTRNAADSPSLWGGQVRDSSPLPAILDLDDVGTQIGQQHAAEGGQPAPVTGRARGHLRARAGVAVMERKIPPLRYYGTGYGFVFPASAARSQERILVLDGAMGTMLHGAALTADDFGAHAPTGLQRAISNLTRLTSCAPSDRALRSTRAPTASRDQHFRLCSLRCRPSKARPTARGRSLALAARHRPARVRSDDALGDRRDGARRRGRSLVTRNVTFDDVRAGYAVQAAGLNRRAVWTPLLLETCAGHAERQGRGDRRCQKRRRPSWRRICR